MLSDLYNKTADILRIILTSDSMGGSTEVKTVLYNNWKCRINWSKGHEKIQFGKDTHYRDAKVYGSVLKNIQQRDRFRYNGKDYEIINIINVDELDTYMILEIRIIE